MKKHLLDRTDSLGGIRKGLFHGGNFKPFPSVFSKLVACFFGILLTISIIYMVSYQIFWKIIYDEMERNVNDRLSNTIERLDKAFSDLQYNMQSVQLETEFKVLQSTGVLNDYRQSLLSKLLVRPTTVIPECYMLAVLMRDAPQIVTKDSVWLNSRFFSHYFINSVYPADFWRKEMDETFAFRYYPSAVYTEKFYGSSEERLLMPVAFKQNNNAKYIFIAFVDVGALCRDAALSTGLSIYNQNGDLLYPSLPPEEEPDFQKEVNGEENSFRKIGGNYYQMIRSKESGFTYVGKSSAAAVEEKMQEVYRIGVFILIIALAFGAAFSLFYAKRLNRPVKKLVKLLDGEAPQGLSVPDSLSAKENPLLAEGFSGNKKRMGDEIAYIQANVESIMARNNRYVRDIQEKNAALADFVNLSRLKNVYVNIREEGFGREGAEGGFFLLCIQIRYRENMAGMMRQTPGEISFLLKELFQYHLSLYFKNLLIFQLENDQLIVKIGCGSAETSLKQGLESLLERMKNENEYAYFHIAVSDFYSDPSCLNDAYQKVLDVSRYYRLDRESQLIFQHGEQYREGKYYFSPQQSSQFESLLQNGHEDAATLCREILSFNCQKGVNNRQMRMLSFQFVHSVVQRMILFDQKSPVELGVPEIENRLEHCVDNRAYEELLTSFIQKAVGYIREHEQKGDPVIQTVEAFILKRYQEDFSLDQLADAACLSKSYLSTIFKERTGENLSEFINRFRIQKAQQILLSTDIKIGELGALVGIFSPDTFLRLFKKYTGASPSEYRRKHALQKID